MITTTKGNDLTPKRAAARMLLEQIIYGMGELGKYGQKYHGLEDCGLNFECMNDLERQAYNKNYEEIATQINQLLAPIISGLDN